MMTMTMKVYFLLAQRVCPFLYDLAWKSVVFALLIGLTAFCVRCASSARRHLVWSVAVYGLLGLPLLTLMLPARQFPFPVAFAVVDPVVSTMTSPITPALPALSPETSTLTPETPIADYANARKFVAATPATGHMSAPALTMDTRTSRAFVPIVWSLWLAAVWGIGVGIVLLRMMMGFVAARHMLRRCEVVTSGVLTAQARRTQIALGVSRPFVLYVGVEKTLPAVPMTMGVREPAILLPANALRWTEERLQSVLLHELAHVKRADWLTQMAALLVCAVYWFNPFVWVIARRLRAESEHACDDMVLSVGMRASDYATHLLAIAQGLRGHNMVPTLLTMAHRPEINSRLEAILEMKKNRQPCTRRTLLGAMILALGVLSPLAVWQTRTQAQPLQQPFSTTAEPVVVSLSESARREDLSPNRPLAEPIMASQWRATLPDGVKVQLDTVGGTLADGKVGHWQPDGSGLTTFQTTNSMFEPGEREISARVVFPPRLVPSQHSVFGSHVTYGIQGRTISNYATGGLSPVWGADRKIKDYYATGFCEISPATQPQAAIVLNIGIDPFQTIISGPPQRDTIRHPGMGETILLSRAYTGTGRSQGHLIAIHGVKVNLPSRYLRASDYNLSYLDRNGKEHAFQYGGANIPDTSGKQAEVRFDFRASEVSLSQIKTFLFRSRPIYTVLFRNVALQPAGSGGHTPQPQ